MICGSGAGFGPEFVRGWSDFLCGIERADSRREGVFPTELAFELLGFASQFAALDGESFPFIGAGKLRFAAVLGPDARERDSGGRARWDGCPSS